MARFIRAIALAAVLMVFGGVAKADTVPWDVQLMPMFEAASAKYDIPFPLLLTLGYYGSSFEDRGQTPSIEGGYGVMGLRDNPLGGDSLKQGAALTGYTIDQLKTGPAANIITCAAVLDDYARNMKIDRKKGLQAWLDPVIKYAGLDAESSRFFAMEVFSKLRNGLDIISGSGEKFGFDPQDIGAVDLNALMPQSLRPVAAAQAGEALPAATDYPNAIWDAAASCNYSTATSNKDTVVVHTIEGSAAGCLSWFKNCNHGTAGPSSSHYVVSESGTVWQMVAERQTAWHAGCYNSRAVGIEHEGYAGSSSHPKALYDGSALLVRDICNRWGIPKEKRTVGPGIIGHIDVTNCCCGTHTDPGNGWDWSYFIQQVVGQPSYAAQYKAQSYPSRMVTGSTAVVWAEYTNTGSNHWAHSSTYLGTQGPQDRNSPFCTSGNWSNCSRPTDVDQPDVASGQVGRFTFVITAPTTPGVYTEKFKPVQEGVTWFGDEITWTITVANDTGNLTGTVRNSTNNQAIAGATVSMEIGKTTTTDSYGVYTLADIAPGTYNITVSKTGFQSVTDTATVQAGTTSTKDFVIYSSDTTPPISPSGFKASGASASQISLSWNATTDAGGSGLAGYVIYRDGSEVGRTAATSFIDSGLPPNTTFSYFARAYDGAGNLSGTSITATASTFPGTTPVLQDGFGSLNGSVWQAIAVSPMPGALSPVWDSSKNNGLYSGAGSLRTQTSTVTNQGCFLAHTFTPGFGVAKFETYMYDNGTSDTSRQGLQVRCMNGSDLKAIYFVGTYSANSYSAYSSRYFDSASGDGWHDAGKAIIARSIGWHKLTIDFLPYTGTNDVKFYIDNVDAGTGSRSIDTLTYGLSMVALGFHYPVNQPAWFDDVAVYASAPWAPTLTSARALSSNSIQWNIVDNSDNETGFKILDTSQNLKAAAGPVMGKGSNVLLDEAGLAPNTPYVRVARAFNGQLDSLSSAQLTKWTLPIAPSTSTVSCNRSTGTWYNNPTFTFTAIGGFGQGTLARYDYKWNANSTYTWLGGEAQWNSGNLIVNSSNPGSYYLHLQSRGTDISSGGTFDFGPFNFDNTAPQNPTSAVEANGAPNGAWQSTVSSPQFNWTGASDTPSGIAEYKVYFGQDGNGTSTTAVTTASYSPGPASSGTYYLRVSAKDNAGNEAPKWATLYTFMYDASATSTPIVTDDGPYSGSKSVLHASWMSTDPESGVVEYQYCVGTSAGASDVVGWKSAGLATTLNINIPAPGLSDSNTYYISIKAKNGAGAWSETGSSDGIRLAQESATIGDAKSLADGTPVALVSKIVTASFSGFYYLEEGNRSSGILVMGPGPDLGAVVTIGGVMGVNGMGERAIMNPAAIVDIEADPARIPNPLYIIGRSLGGGRLGLQAGIQDFKLVMHVDEQGNPYWTKEPFLYGGASNIGLFVKTTGYVTYPSLGSFYLDGIPETAGGAGAAIRGVKVDWPFGSASMPADGSFIEIEGISSCTMDDGIIVRMLRPLTANSVRVLPR